MNIWIKFIILPPFYLAGANGPLTDETIFDLVLKENHSIVKFIRNLDIKCEVQCALVMQLGTLYSIDRN